MKPAILVVAALLVLGFNRAAEPPGGRPPEYGVPASDTVTVVVSQIGFDRWGRYHVKKGTALREVVARAGLSRIVHSIFVTRTVNGKERVLDVPLDHKQRPPVVAIDFILLDGDIIRGHERIP